MCKFFVALWCALCVGASCYSASVLVLPFHNSSQYSDLNWVGESIAETLDTEFGAANEIVYDRSTRTEALRRLSLRGGADYTKATLIRLGESLDADYICFGNFDLTLPQANAALKDGVVRMSATFIDLRKLHDGPDLSETGNLSELWRLEEHLAFESLQYLDPKLGLTVDHFLGPQKAVRVDAEESYMRGLLSSNREQKQKWLLQAVALNPGFAGPAYELGRLYLEEKQYAQAIAWFRKIPSSDPRYDRSRFRMGLAAYDSGDYNAAVDDFRELLKNYPLNEVYNNLGAAEAAANQPNALEDLRHAVEGEPANTAYAFNLALASLKKGDGSTAVTELKSVLDQNPTDTEAADLLNHLKQEANAQALVKPSMFRLRTNFNEAAYRQLKAMIESTRQ